MSETFIDQACEILQKTHDGDDLAPEHLKLVEIVVNGWVNEAGEVAFTELLASVRAGYTKPWLHGVEHLTRDHEGFVYWKGQEIDHWSGNLPYNANGRHLAHSLARRCRKLETWGEPVNTTTVIWRWETVRDRHQERV